MSFADEMERRILQRKKAEEHVKQSEYAARSVYETQNEPYWQEYLKCENLAQDKEHTTFWERQGLKGRMDELKRNSYVKEKLKERKEDWKADERERREAMDDHWKHGH